MSQNARRKQSGIPGRNATYLEIVSLSLIDQYTTGLIERSVENHIGLLIGFLYMGTDCIGRPVKHDRFLEGSVEIGNVMGAVFYVKPDILYQ